MSTRVDRKKTAYQYLDAAASVAVQVVELRDYLAKHSDEMPHSASAVRDFGRGWAALEKAWAAIRRHARVPR